MSKSCCDPLVHAWNEASHKDDWNVPVVYQSTFLRLVAEELDRAADDLLSGQGGKELRKRAKALRALAKADS